MDYKINARCLASPNFTLSNTSPSEFYQLSYEYLVHYQGEDSLAHYIIIWLPQITLAMSLQRSIKLGDIDESLFKTCILKHLTTHQSNISLCLMTSNQIRLTCLMKARISQDILIETLEKNLRFPIILCGWANHIKILIKINEICVRIHMVSIYNHTPNLYRPHQV